MIVRGTKFITYAWGENALHRGNLDTSEMLGSGARVASRPGGALHQWLSLLEA